MRRLKIYDFICMSLIIFALAIGGCGLSGDNGGVQSGTDGEINYTGLTTQAKTTVDNANDIFSVIWTGGTSAISDKKSASKSLSVPGIISMERTITGMLNIKHHIISDEEKSKRAASITRNGSVSGTLTTDGSLDAKTGTGTLTLTYQNYNDGTGTYEGVVTVRVNAYNLQYQVITDMTMSFALWTIKNNGLNISASGSIRVEENLSGNTETQTFNMVTLDNNSKETSKQENFVVVTVFNNIFSPSNKTETATGRVYIEKYGYVDVTTTSPFIYSTYPQANPDNGGSIIVSGAANSAARITPLSTSSVRIEVDTDGDGTIESNNVYSWNNLAGLPEPDNTAPTVLSTTPANAATGVAINTTIVATFSEPMNPATVTNAEFSLINGATPVSGAITYNGTTATFTPSTSLSYNTLYTATINNGVKDLAGNQMSTTYSWTFKTRVPPFIPNPSPLPPLNQSVAYQIDYAHSGRTAFGTPLTFPMSPTWSKTFSGAVSYPLIAGGKVFVVTAGSGTGSGTGYGTQLYALNEQTGNIVWGPVAISGTYYWSGHAYDHGKVFVVNFDGLLQAFDAATGNAVWSVKLPNQYAFSAPPTAVNGIVYVGGAGSGGTLYAVDESYGNLLWSASVMNGSMSSPTVSSDGVFVSYPCQVYKFNPLSGASLWHYSGGCSGGGGRTAAYANDLLFVRDWTSQLQGQIFDASTGTKSGNFNAGPIPAFSAQTGFFQSAGTLQRIDLGTHSILWNFVGDGKLVSAPIVIDQVVIVGSSSGNVYAINADTGSQIWSGYAGASINGPDEWNVSQPLTGFAAGEGYLVVPAGNVVSAWHISGP